MFITSAVELPTTRYFIMVLSQSGFGLRGLLATREGNLAAPNRHALHPQLHGVLTVRSDVAVQVEKHDALSLESTSTADPSHLMWYRIVVGDPDTAILLSTQRLMGNTREPISF